MPSWCVNHVTIFSEKPQLLTQLRVALETSQDLFGQFFPRPAQFDAEDKWYDWDMQNWGTKWDASPQKIQWHGDETTFEILTAWDPPVIFYQRLEALGYEVDAFYLIEDFKTLGHYTKGEHQPFDFSNVQLEELEQELPGWAEPVFGVATNSRLKTMQTSQFDLSKPYPRTPWFSPDLMPVRDGFYEVRTANSEGELSPPRRLSWRQGKWDLSVYVAYWRGISHPCE